MLAFFLIVVFVPLLLVGAAFVLLDGITAKELGLIVLAVGAVAGTSAGIVSCSNTHDVEVWNGRVTHKDRVAVSCSHSYTCNCITTCTGGKAPSCSTTCQTCYEHSFDYDWNATTSNGETVTIDRVDRQGLAEPARFRAIVIGEPTAIAHSYKNYVKASPGSLFRHQGLKERYVRSLPSYPQDIYDYYKLDRLVLTTDGAFVHEPVAGWNERLSRINADLGRRKQVNAIVVITHDKPRDWFYALEESWIGGKKNDVVLVISVDPDMRPQWAEVMAWTTNELFKVRLRDDVMDMKTVNRDATLVRVESDIETLYQRKPMADFEYLSSSIAPSSTQWTLTLVIALLVAAGLTWFFQVRDVFGDERSARGQGNPFRRRRPAWLID